MFFDEGDNQTPIPIVVLRFEFHSFYSRPSKAITAGSQIDV